MDRAIFLKAASYCAYQERTQDEVRKRLSSWNVWGDAAEEIITELILENFLNEERFSKVFAGSKFRVKKWGKRKIIFELKQRRLSDYCIKIGLKEIDDEDYYQTLKELLEKKRHDYRKAENPFAMNQKLSKFAIGKGFESSLVWEILNEK